MRVVWIVVGVLLALWLLGAVLQVAGSLIHLLFVIAVIIVIYELIKRFARRN